MVEIRAFGASDVGHHRAINEDGYYVGENLYLVADGMGGHSAGDVASRLTVESMRLADSRALSEREVRSGIAQANDAVARHAAAHPESQGMGTTLAGVALLDRGGNPTWLVYNLGDSRVYLYAEGRLSQITVDHSEVQEMITQGLITPVEARVHPARHVITRSVGEIPFAEPDLVYVPCQSGQRILICSDGLSNELDDRSIERAMATSVDAEDLVNTLLQSALDAGGRDNVTVVVVDVAGHAEPETSDHTTVPRELIEREIAT